MLHPFLFLTSVFFPKAWQSPSQTKRFKDKSSNLLYGLSANYTEKTADMESQLFRKQAIHIYLIHYLCLG